jgi:hypothetical protein
VVLALAAAAFGMLNYQTIVNQFHPGQFVVKHVIVIVLEDKNESYVLGNSNAPYINDILIPNYSIAEDYYSVGHPSLQDYIAMTAGGTLGVTNDETPGWALTDKNLVDLFSEHNITWKGYMESMMGQNDSCGSELLSSTINSYGYVTRHNPFVYYTDIMNNMTRCRQIVPLTQFSIDLTNNQLPDFSFITPNVLDDGHTTPSNATTCPPSGTSLQCADIWLSGFLPQVTKNPVFSNTIVFITWDESARIGNETKNTNPNNQVLLIAVSPDSKKGFVDNTTLYSHYSLLATIEKIYDLGTLGRNDTTANVIGTLFVNNTVSKQTYQH